MRIRLLLIAALLFPAGALAQMTEAKAPIQSALFLKLLGFNKTLPKDVTILVIGNPDMAAELKKVVGTPIGATSMLASVETGTGMAGEPSIVYLGSEAAQPVLAECAARKVLSISGNPKVKASLRVLVGPDGKPKVLLNAGTSKAEGADWNPAIMKVAVPSND